MGILGILVIMLCSIVMAMVERRAHSQSVDQSPKAVEKWFKRIPYVKEKLTKLHFYFHDVITAKNPTTVQVATANTTTAESPTVFGAVFVMDDPLTQGPDPNSKLIGRAEGIFASVSHLELSLLMTLNFVFTDGKYNGSTLCVLGHSPIFHTYRELPILGGPGVFRLARGIATTKTYFHDLTTKNAVVEYHLVVRHY